MPGVGSHGAVGKGVRGARAVLVLLLLAGCATVHQPAGGAMSLKTAPPLPPSTVDGSPGTVHSLPPLVSPSQDAAALARLTRLRDDRLRHGPGTDTPVGPGDVIEVAAPQVKELAFTTTRVSGDGIIVLPIVGTIRAAGRSEDAIRQDIRQKLGGIMYDPQVSVFVREYRSRKVAVIGAVLKAGIYEPATPTDTIFDMLAMAQGPVSEASRTVVFIPQAARDAAALGTLVPGKDGAPGAPAAEALLRNVEPIVFNLREMSAAMSEVVLSLPVRPGDVIMIPDAGSVYIQGWVHRPGNYKIEHDLTMLAVIAAAGGPSFPADMSAARLIRGTAKGDKEVHDVDLQAVARGEHPDVYVQNGDVIEIGATAPKLVAYGVFTFFTTVFQIGAAIPVF